MEIKPDLSFRRHIRRQLHWELPEKTEKWDRSDLNREPKDYESAGDLTVGEANQCSTNELQHSDEFPGLCAQQKSQHFGITNGADAVLNRLFELWPLLSVDDRRSLVDDAERLVDIARKR